MWSPGHLVTWSPAWLWLVHVDSMRPQRSLVQPARLRRLALVVQLSDYLSDNRLGNRRIVPDVHGLLPSADLS